MTQEGLALAFVHDGAPSGTVPPKDLGAHPGNAAHAAVEAHSCAGRLRVSIQVGHNSVLSVILKQIVQVPR